MKMQMIMFSVMASFSLVADTHVWTGGGMDADWTDALNFDIGKPDPGDVVEIPSGQTVKIGNDASLTIVKELSELKVDGVFFTSSLKTTSLKRLTGSGLVTNEVTSGYKNLELLAGKHDFSGRIAGPIYVLVKGCARLTGVDNVVYSPFSVQSTSTGETDFENLVARGVGVAHVASFGLKGQSSSVGTNDIHSLNYGGGYVYLGNGEKTDRQFYVVYPQTGFSYLDGGAYGGLEWAGSILVNGNGMTSFGLLGSNETAACVFSGEVTGRDAGGTNYCLFLEKAGSGIWRFADSDNNKAKRSFWSSMAIRGGTLQFDSMKEAGEACSLGLATNLTAIYRGPRNDAEHPGSYAYWVGKSGRTVSFEFTGTNGAFATRRPVALEGDAKLVNNTTHPWRFSGVRSVGTGARKLYLSGSGAADNELAGLGEAEGGPISIVKEGAGTWTLNGSNTFSGTVSVKAGTLKLRGDADGYSWFRWTIQNKSDSAGARMYLTEFGLYDAQGVRVGTNLAFNANWHELQPGQIALYREGSYSVNPDRPFNNLTDGSTTPFEFSYYQYGTTTYESPLLSDRETWIPFVMRVDENAGLVKYYDVCIHYPSGKSSNYKNNPNAWMLEGSVDGLHWDVLHTTNNVPLASAAYTWTTAGVVYKSTTETEAGVNGCEIAMRPAYNTPTVFTNTVSVAAEATLEAIGNVTLTSVAVDPSSSGVFSGVSIAESGHLDVASFPQNGSLGKVFANAKDLSNLENWSVSSQGRACRSWHLVVKADGEVCIAKDGLVVIVN